MTNKKTYTYKDILKDRSRSELSDGNLKMLFCDFELRNGKEVIWNNRPHYVVPAIAIREGVFTPASEDGKAVYIPAEELRRSSIYWQGKPAVFNHPGMSGLRNANHPDYIQSNGMGYIFSSTITDDNKIRVDIYFDEDKISTLPDEMQETFANIKAGKHNEVSVGFYSDNFLFTDNFNGKAYEIVIYNIIPDHLAILEKGVKGACSGKDGCGVGKRFESLLKKNVLNYCNGDCGCGNCNISFNKPLESEDTDMSNDKDNENEGLPLGDKQNNADPEVKSFNAEEFSDMISKAVNTAIEPIAKRVEELESANTEPDVSNEDTKTINDDDVLDSKSFQEAYKNEFGHSVDEAKALHAFAEKAIGEQRKQATEKVLKSALSKTYTEDDLNGMPLDSLAKLAKSTEAFDAKGKSQFNANESANENASALETILKNGNAENKSTATRDFRNHDARITESRNQKTN